MQLVANKGSYESVTFVADFFVFFFFWSDVVFYKNNKKTVLV